MGNKVIPNAKSQFPKSFQTHRPSQMLGIMGFYEVTSKGLDAGFGGQV